MYDKRQRLVGLLGVHVDDGVWAGTGPVYEAARKYVRATLNVTKEKLKEFVFLGKRFRQREDVSIFVDQMDYSKEIKSIYIPASRRRQSSELADEAEKTKSKSLVQQLAWPARSIMPELCYSVSDIQQRANDSLDIATMIRASTTLRVAKERAKAGHGIYFPAGPRGWTP